MMTGIIPNTNADAHKHTRMRACKRAHGCAAHIDALPHTRKHTHTFYVCALARAKQHIKQTTFLNNIKNEHRHTPHTDTHAHTRTHTHTQAHTRTHTHTNTHTRMTHAHTPHSYTHTYAYIKHNPTHTRTHTHMHVLRTHTCANLYVRASAAKHKYCINCN